MHSKQFLLLAILSVVVILSAANEESFQQDDGSRSTKKLVVFPNKEDNKDKAKDAKSDANGKNVDSSSAHGRNSGRSRYDYWARYFRENAVPAVTPPVAPAPAVNTGPQCHTLIDSQYPIFSDMCGAVPQARYALPNSFGHYDRWQVSHILTTLIGSSTDPVCIRSLRHLLCPMLFQPCRVRHEPPVILPCQNFCRAVKVQCSIPALDVIPCDFLPFASDLCPTIQPPSAFSPTGVPPTLAPTPVEPTTPATPTTTVPPSPKQFDQPAQPTVPQMPPATLIHGYNRVSYGNDGQNKLSADPSNRQFYEYRSDPRYTQLSTQHTKPRAPGADSYPSNQARYPNGPVSPAAKA